MIDGPSHQLFVQHAEFEVGEHVRRSDVDRLLVARESHLVLPLALVGAAQATENFAAQRVHLQQRKKRSRSTSGILRSIQASIAFTTFMTIASKINL